jgi:AraC-like DNA-binding protein
VRRAIAFIEQHPDADISVADIAAAAANVSIRAVQFAFRRHLDTTPMDYLRTVRLDRAHHDLLTTNPSLGDTVTARWGFHHHSRFAARYRHAYGVTPPPHPPQRDRVTNGWTSPRGWTRGHEPFCTAAGLAGASAPQIRAHRCGLAPRGTRLVEPPPAHTGFRFPAGQSPSRRARTSWRPPMRCHSAGTSPQTERDGSNRPMTRNPDTTLSAPTHRAIQSPRHHRGGIHSEMLRCPAQHDSAGAAQRPAARARKAGPAT